MFKPLDIVLLNKVIFLFRGKERNRRDLVRDQYTWLKNMFRSSTSVTPSHPLRNEVRLVKNVSGGGLATVRSVARIVRRTSLSSSAMASGVLWLKNN